MPSAAALRHCRPPLLLTRVFSWSNGRGGSIHRVAASTAVSLPPPHNEVGSSTDGYNRMSMVVAVAGQCSTTLSGLVPGHRAGGAGVGRTRSPPTHGPGVPSGHGHCAHTGAGAVRCVQPGLAARSRGRRARAGRRLCRAASAPAWSRHRPPRQVGAPGPDSPSYLLTALGDLSCIVVSCIGWSAARANSQ